MKKCLLIIFGLIFLTSCGILPKIKVIDDPLSKQEHLKLALAYEKDGELDLAEREYRFALPLPVANLGLGNIFFQKGEPKKAQQFYEKALETEIIPSAANNLAWLYLVEGGSLNEAERLATMAVQEAQKLGASSKEIESYQATLKQIQTAIEAQDLSK
jgi:Tfp pilus assembly protein PilF